MLREYNMFQFSKKKKLIAFNEGDIIKINDRLVRVQLTKIGWKYQEVKGEPNVTLSSK
jgi:hypothetical protein